MSLDRPQAASRSAHATCASMLACALLVLALASGASRAQAGPLAGLRGHVGLGYSKLLTADGPGGSLGGAAGFDLPVSPTLRAGIEIGMGLLGTRTVEDSAQVAELDYTLVEVLAMAHWRPTGAGPIGRVSLGAGLFGPRIEQSSSAPVSFESYTLRGAAPGLAASLTFMPHDGRPLTGGLELGARYVVVDGDDWLVTHLRLVVHY